MPKVVEACTHVRSKNAGPFWITLDLTFPNSESFERHRRSPVLQAAAVGSLYGVNPAAVRRYEVPILHTLKISYPRARPQGGALERDMHGGQQYVRLLDLEL